MADSEQPLLSSTENREKHSVVVIGGGWSGIYALKYLLGEGLDAHLYESRSNIGGIWYFDENENVSGVYKSAHVTSSKTFLHASDFPFPKTIGEFPSHEEVLAYLHSYADHFKLWSNIHLNSKIVRVEPQWSLILNDGLKIIDCNYLVVCSGQHQIASDPRSSYPFNQFTGTFSHSITYKTPYDNKFINKRILVVGGGETASDLAVELSATIAKRVYMSIRGGQWFQARILGQQPADIMYTMLMRLYGYYDTILVRCWRRMFFVPMWGVGGTGIREWTPTVPFLHGFINKSREIVDHVALNRVIPKRGIKTINEQLITFDKEENPIEIDHILLCTGFQWTHPFFSSTDIHDLYKLVFASGVDGTLAFVGTARPVFGSIPALAELQARWVAAVFSGRRRLPSEKVMAKSRRAYWARHANLYPHDHKRLKQLVNLFEYSDVIGDELGVRVALFYLFFRHPRSWYRIYCASPWSPFLFRIGRLSSDDEKLAYQRHLACIPEKDQAFHRYNDVMLSAYNDIYFEFETYEEFRKERLKLNYDSTLKLWYSLPNGLPTLDNNLVRRQTIKQQRARLRKMKFFAFYCTLFKKTFLKKKIQSKGFRLWNETLNVPTLEDESLYGIYKSMGRITTEFLNKGRRYDETISYEELFKAGRTVWFMIAFQMQLNLPLILTDSIFGYNMLYPYTDDLVDSNDVSREAKADFAKLFHERLLVGEPTYDSQVHFDGKQSNVAELKLPSSLQSQANRIVKIFDMVKFIENDWKRGGEYEGVYMSLATIHESQMKSTLQHARTEDSYAPTMTQVEQVSAEKGGASLIAAGFLIEGRLTRAKIAYLEYLGFGLQLLDDLQDVKEDMKNNHRTIFTQTLAEGRPLDVPTARLIQYCYCAPAYEKFSDDQRTISDRKTGVTLAQYVRVSMMMFSVVLVLEAASRLQEYYSKEFYRELSSLSPFTFNDLKAARVEETLWAIVRNQWF
ncbi:unnamed protein product [Rotaria sordida]|uniref:Flavin-containing monooxygenase n=1 Tax=Rotaria sordida TaxID=392033 RepID=A0A814UJQ7_9BILA|nr:unnamed protein product [Rotaria sordida]CAF1175603.1 unnamed protein product [Rotaria sordida]